MNKIKTVLTADWHFGHRRVPTYDIVSDIRKFFLPELDGTVDLLVIAGDIFDCRISFNDNSASLIIDLFVDIFTLCYEHSIIIRIVRGTYSHDILQNAVIDKLYKKMGIPVDYRLVNNMSVELMDKLGISLLYMPDNLPYNTKNEALETAKMMLTANDLKRVDYVVIHGEFEHMNYGHINNNAYSVADFNTICNGLILAGHIHKPHRHKNVIYAGSITRLAHNEEEAKGFWVINDAKSRFIENKAATKFITVDYRNDTEFDVILIKHIELCNTFDKDRIGFLRLIITDTNLRQAIAGYHNANYPNIKLSFKRVMKNDAIDSKFLSDKLKQTTTEVLTVPSLKNIALIVCEHTMTTYGVAMDITAVESIINGGM